MLAMNEPASDVDRRAEETLNPQRLKSDGSANCIDYRIDRTHLVELDLLGLNVMNLAFRNRELRENVGRYLFSLRSQLAFMNHCQNLRGLSMKVPGIMMMVFMFVRMFVLMVMTMP